MKIKNCFCGSPAELERNSAVFVRQDYSDRYEKPISLQAHGFRVRCIKCGMQTCWWHLKDEAVSIWNKPARIYNKQIHLTQKQSM